MEGTEQHIIAVIKNILSAIAMMEVYIQYSGALCTLIKQILRCNSSIIEKAVATKHINGSMMPWGLQRENIPRSPWSKALAPVKATSLEASAAAQVPSVIEVSAARA